MKAGFELDENGLLPIDAAPCGLAAVLRKQGFTALTPIQSGVLEQNATGKDLRLTSQTGSGKTVAVGLAMAEQIAAYECRRGIARPVALIIAPTRELASQLGRELSWLYAPLRRNVMVVTGGTSVMAERRELQRGPHVVVGTPGRLLDHLRRDAMSLENLQVVVLDEADEMLDMGFEEELDGILEFAPEERQTHLVSATFKGHALKLAKRLQKNGSVGIEGTPLGQANTDIEHHCILTHPNQQLDVIVNLLLRFEGDKTLVFVRTRADTTGLSRALADLGFSAAPLSGEMSQRERTDTFDRFRKGTVRCLVATDVAARGLDVHDIGMVVHVDLPQNADILTHRSGRTGRAGRTGRNIILVTPRAQRRANALLRTARMRANFVDAPSPESIHAAADARLVDVLKEDAEDPRLLALAEKLLMDLEPLQVIQRLLSKVKHDGPTGARRLASPRKPKKRRDAPGHESYGRESYGREDRGRSRDYGGGDDRGGRGGRGGQSSSRGPRDNPGDFVSFQVSWGGDKGADPRRLLAIACRRGDVTRQEVGSIRVGPKSSMVDVAKGSADKFEAASRRPDRRDAHVRFRRWQKS